MALWIRLKPASSLPPGQGKFAANVGRPEVFSVSAAALHGLSIRNERLLGVYGECVDGEDLLYDVGKCVFRAEIS